MVTVTSRVAGFPTLLSAAIVTGNTPVVVGVPDRTPAALRVSPVGRVPVVRVIVGIG